ncbi:TBC1 domain family member 30 [Araneus ventricosus]|uniref:TBC1 domain family member 30 n=1 Tax=Araneus ventricosus TaxID=182803 RepID=A0A4Y2VVK2_ARAVE|nr:TBC1 domain family member 30 [Araneus ventricosus]
MQWFLTLFTNCLPKDTVLRVWDLIFLEGNEVLLRTALAIWDGLADRIMAVESADEFYCIMGVLTREILEFGLMDANMFVKEFGKNLLNIGSCGPCTLHSRLGVLQAHGDLWIFLIALYYLFKNSPAQRDDFLKELEGALPTAWVARKCAS